MMWPDRRGRAEGERKEAQAGTEESEGEREDAGSKGGEGQHSAVLEACPMLCTSQHPDASSASAEKWTGRVDALAEPPNATTGCASAEQCLL